MKRHKYNDLLEWKHSQNRKPLILWGARQVGKTHLLKSFGENEFHSYLYLNFEADPNLSCLFTNDLKPSTLLDNIQIYLNQAIDPEKTLLIFDEIQECPEALTSLKYFQEQAPDYHIVTAGSFLGVKMNQVKGFPVGKVHFLDLYPLSFFEFLEAIGKNKLGDFLIQLNEFKTIPEPIHHELLFLLKKYMYIGGMPAAVEEYVKTENLLPIRKIQNDILNAYLLDFAKHVPKNQLAKITTIWQSIPKQLVKENKKFIFSAIKKTARAREYEESIQWLADTGLIHQSYNLDSTNKNAFKIFLLDVGLLSAMSDIPAKTILDERGLFTEFHGAFTENYIAQTLAAKNYSLSYWTSEGIAELDFILEHDKNIFPLEVETSPSCKKKSLQVYGEKYQPKVLLRASLMNLKKEGNSCNFPLYLIGQWINILCP